MKREAAKQHGPLRGADYDVVVVGYGPVGQTAAALLGQAGHRVAVFERFAQLYQLPRAVHVDDEVMRVWQALGIVPELSEDLQPINTYDWFGADGEAIVQIRQPSPGPSGWSPSNSIYQPNLERVLDRTVGALPNVELHRGWSAARLLQRADRVELGLRATRELEPGVLAPAQQTIAVSARYLIGADGANSFVREALGIEFEDLGFAEQWLVVDVRPNDMDALAHLPVAAQWCDPARPHMHIQNGRRHRRFEFMLLPGESAEDFDEERVWQLLAPRFTPRDGTIGRSATYEFRGRLARTMRRGRVLLAGDAAKTTPPFMGQGLCGGIRDVINAAWRLDLLLRGVADATVLEDYSPERRAQNARIIVLSTEMGRVSCVLERAAAEDRDTALRAVPSPPPLGLRRLECGLIAEDFPLAGELSVQGTLAVGGGEGLHDELIGPGFQLLTRAPAELCPADAALMTSIGARVLSLEAARDVDGRLTSWFDEHGIAAALVRPDFYVFGAVRALDELPALLETFRSKLTPRLQGATHMTTARPVIRPKLHHVNLKTRRLQEMIDFYATLVGAEVIHQYELGAWISNDEANHRIALLAFPNFVEDAGKDTRTGLHHIAFEYASFDELNDSYLRLKETGITPAICLDHGMTFSYYYVDPDRNHVELQADNFGDWNDSREWMRTSDEFRADPLGKFVDPERVASARAEGTSFEAIHARAIAGELAPEGTPLELPRVGA